MTLILALFALYLLRSCNKDQDKQQINSGTFHKADQFLKYAERKQSQKKKKSGMGPETETFVSEFETAPFLSGDADIDLPVKCVLCVQKLCQDSIYSIKQVPGKCF